MSAKFLKPILLFSIVAIACSCATINKTNNTNSYDVLNNTYPKQKLSWFEMIVIGLFESAKEDQERKFGPKISVHPDNETRPFGQ